MTEKILIAFDESENAMRAVRYVARHFAPSQAVTLMHVLQDTAALCDMQSPELTPLFRAQQASFCELENQKQKLVSEALNQARDVLVEAGFEPNRVVLKLEKKKRGVARDLVAEAQNGYGLVVIGRRGAAGIKEFFLGSITHKTLNLAGDLSILIVN